MLHTPSSGTICPRGAVGKPLCEFDRQGFLVIHNLLTPAQVTTLAGAVDALEEHAVARLDAPPRKRSPWGAEYHRDPDLGYHVHGAREQGATVIIEDFWNADPAFEVLIGHPPTMPYVDAVIQGRATIAGDPDRRRVAVAGEGEYRLADPQAACRWVVSQHRARQRPRPQTQPGGVSDPGRGVPHRRRGG